MKKYLNAAMVYLILGLVAGVFYREFTKLSGFEGETVLRGLHTHILVLGFMFFMVALLIENNFKLSRLKYTSIWFTGYHVAFGAVIVTMLIRGISEVRGVDVAGLSHMAGLAHALLGVVLIWYTLLVGKAVKQIEA